MASRMSLPLSGAALVDIPPNSLGGKYFKSNRDSGNGGCCWKGGARLEPEGRSETSSMEHTDMDDWLAELRETKEDAIEQMQAEIVRGQLHREETQEQSGAGQAQVAALIKRVEIERLLQQFTSEILQDHPFFSNIALTRTVRSKAVGSTGEFTEPTPWSAPVAENPLPDHLDLGNGHYVIAIDWKLQANYRHLHDYEIQSYRLKVSTSASQVLMDGQLLSAQTPDAFKTQLTTTFRNSLEHLNRRRVRRHRHRPWHRHLWRTFFPRTNLTTRFLIVVIVVLVLAILLALVAGQILVGM